MVGLVADWRRVTNQALVVENEEPLTNSGSHELAFVNAELRA
jgi:hypothetical protein